MYNELTETDIKKMQEEIDYRISVLRPKIGQEIVDARAQGDLSENADYHAARRAKGRNESRIEYLKEMIKTAKIIFTEPDQNTVGIFDKVEVLFEEDGSIETMQLSTTMRNDPSQNIVSKDSPFGVAVMGKKIGDRVLIKVSPEYSYYVVIKSIQKATQDDVDLPIV